MTVYVYAGLFDDDLDGLADRMDEARVNSVSNTADVLPMEPIAGTSENHFVATESV